MVYKVSGGDVLRKFSLEPGIHRLQRVPPTERNDRRHTSTIAVCILPYVAFDPKYSDRDFRVECTMGSGPGGQHRNKTMSAVKVTHIPTSMSVCIDARCQHTNRQTAMAILISRLRARDIGQHSTVENQSRQSQIAGMGRGDGKIRTYNFIEGRVKDARTSKKFRIKDVMDGKLDLIYGAVGDLLFPSPGSAS